MVHAFRDADAARSGPVASGHTECSRDNDAPTRARAAVVTAAEPYRSAAHGASRAEVAKGDECRCFTTPVDARRAALPSLRRRAVMPSAADFSSALHFRRIVSARSRPPRAATHSCRRDDVDCRP
ncbi:hypothetical protein BURMUCF1_A1858 [Burkholderia multivorans ATCC BAA-247]|nr:hypothetical protein BURMUCF1_A1858 [Burkholderia multivorans ATCC BAA-247]